MFKSTLDRSITRCRVLREDGGVTHISTIIEQHRKYISRNHYRQSSKRAPRSASDIVCEIYLRAETHTNPGITRDNSMKTTRAYTFWSGTLELHVLICSCFSFFDPSGHTKNIALAGFYLGNAGTLLHQTAPFPTSFVFVILLVFVQYHLVFFRSCSFHPNTYHSIWETAAVCIFVLDVFIIMMCALQKNNT